MRHKRCLAGFGSGCPPDEIHVEIYFLQQGSTNAEAVKFFNHYTAKGWSNAEGRRGKNWKRLAWTWICYQQSR